MSRRPPHNLALPLDAFQNLFMPSSPATATATPMDYIYALSCFSDPELDCGIASSSEKHASQFQAMSSQYGSLFPPDAGSSQQPNSMKQEFPHVFNVRSLF
jgi:hypothetical protein